MIVSVPVVVVFLLIFCLLSHFFFFLMGFFWIKMDIYFIIMSKQYKWQKLRT